MTNARSFAPIIDEDSRILILGTMPGAKSLEEKQYYANKSNKFWDIIYAVFTSKPDTTYEERIAFLKRKGIALWDVIHTCTREGSSDRKIRNPKFNDFEDLLQKFSNIRCIYCNGRTSEEYFSKCHALPADSPIKSLYLPSTSSANTKMGTQRKIEEWKKIHDCLD